MYPSDSTDVSLAPSGLVVSAVGFLLTRGTVATGAERGAVRFLVAGLLPLVLGLSLAAFGVVLTVGSFSRPYVRRVAAWCLTGTATMAGFVALGMVGQSPDAALAAMATDLGSDPVLTSVLIGGSLGGTFTGVYAARSLRQRDRLRYRTDRMRLVNRLLRDRVLNAVNVIQGRAELVAQSDGGLTGRGGQVLSDRLGTIEAVIDDVTYLVGSDADDGDVRPRGVAGPLTTAVRRAQSRYPVEDWAPDRDGDDLDHAVWASAELEQALYLVIAAAADAIRSPKSVAVDVAERPPDRVDVTVRAAPSDGAVVDPADDPEAGTKLELAGLTVGRYGGTVTTGTETDDGTACSCVTVSLRRASSQSLVPGTSDSGRYGVPIPRLAAAAVASLVAGVAMGAVVATVGGLVPVIGALYGFTDPFVGWVAHLFHSVVFGVVYAGLLVATPDRYVDRFAGALAVALAWSLGLWAVAAGVVMPLWLHVVGIPATLPQLTGPSLLGHLVWGVTLAAVYRLISDRATRAVTDRRAAE